MTTIERHLRIKGKGSDPFSARSDMYRPICSHSVSFLSILTLTLVLWSCGGGPTTPSGGGGAAAPTVVSVAVTGDLSVSEGQTSQLTATATLSDSTTQNVTTQATWVSSAPAVATISATGVLSALTTGTARISASYQNQTASRELEVQAVRFRLTVDRFSVEVLGTCDDFIQGLTRGEFTTRVSVVDSNGTEIYELETPSYPGDPDRLATLLNGGLGQSNTLPGDAERTLAGQAGQSLRVNFRATEWDEQIVIFPPSTRWVRCFFCPC